MRIKWENNGANVCSKSVLSSQKYYRNARPFYVHSVKYGGNFMSSARRFSICNFRKVTKLEPKLLNYHSEKLQICGIVNIARITAFPHRRHMNPDFSTQFIPQSIHNNCLVLMDYGSNAAIKCPRWLNLLC